MGHFVTAASANDDRLWVPRRPATAAADQPADHHRPSLPADHLGDRFDVQIVQPVLDVAHFFRTRPVCSVCSQHGILYCIVVVSGVCSVRAASAGRQCCGSPLPPLSAGRCRPAWLAARCCGRPPSCCLIIKWLQSAGGSVYWWRPPRFTPNSDRPAAAGTAAGAVADH